MVSQRQLQTDLDYAVPTREYQLDQSSLLTASAAADLVLVRKKRPAHLDRSLHIISVDPLGSRTIGPNEISGGVLTGIIGP